MDNVVGFTSTVPVEVLIAAGLKPVDLNNLFITDENPKRFMEIAHSRGFPENVCSWIAGIYGVVVEKGIKRVVGVVQGDCSNTHVLMEILRLEGVEVIPFEYPIVPDPAVVKRKILDFCERVGAKMEEAEEVRRRLTVIRRKLRELDRLTFEENKVKGFENHIYLVSSSDFGGDPEKFLANLEKFIKEVTEREPFSDRIRLGVVGVPPIFNFYDFLEEMGARVVYNETQRQFSMPFDVDTLEEQYARYTYPYGMSYRLKTDVIPEIKRRELDGIIHYVQAFCHRRMEDIILRRKLKLPVVTVEGSEPFKFDGRTKLRLESFLEMMFVRKGYEVLH